MKKKLNIVLLFIGIIIQSTHIFPSTVSHTNISKKYEMEIYLDKYEYLEAEYICLRVKVRNTSSNIDSIQFLTDKEISESIIIKDEKGEATSSAIQSTVFIVGRGYTIIPANGEINYIMPLRTFWGFKNFETYEKDGLGSIARYFPAGRYQIEINFKYDGGKKNIRSNKICFNVKKPVGEEKLALESLKEIYKLPYGGMYGQDATQKAILSWIEFMNKYKNSIYYENAFRESIDKRKFANFKYDTTLTNDCIWFITKMPNSITSRTAVNAASYFIKETNSNDKAIEFLEKIKRDYPETEASRWSDKLLKSEQFIK